MKNKSLLKFFILAIFFLSGATGLIYQVIWIRQLVVIFGSTTHSTVSVVAAFMAGLAIGSYIIGKFADRVKNLLVLYGILELAVGLFSLATFILFPFIRFLYQNTFTLFSGSIQAMLIYKFFLASLAILPATIAMGGTLPVLIIFFTRQDKQVVVATSRLYAINTLGAFFGTLGSAFVFIELLGLRLTVILAVVTNLGISLIVYWFFRREGKNADRFSVFSGVKAKSAKNETQDLSYQDRLVLFIFGLSGLVSLSYEILWTRLLTPSVGTFIYAFAAILAIYLVGIAVGSYLFELLFAKNKSAFFIFGLLELGIGLSGLTSVIFNSNFVAIPASVKVLLTIIPGSLFMGMTFPSVVKIFSLKKKIGKIIGSAYAANTTGSILGSILAAYLIIPVFGTVKGIIVCTLLNFIFAYLLITQEKLVRIRSKYIAFTIVIIVFIISSWLLRLNPLVLQEASIKKRLHTIRERGNYQEMFLEDEIATVLGYSQIGGGDKALFIDGVQTTSPGPDTTLLAHIPISLHPNPKKMLVIAFGMGGTYRSALLHDNLKVDAVDLVPSVPKMFRLFHDDANEVLANPRGRIIINDGRNYVRTSKEKYDIIVIDPPPPINASGTTILYSREFYEDSKKILNGGGLFAAWFYTGATVNDFKSLFKSFTDEFPHVLAINSVITSGIYLIGSNEPITFNKDYLAPKFLEPNVYADNNKTILDGSLIVKIPFITADSVCERILGDREVLEMFIGNRKPITDDRPRSEYFLLDHKLNPSSLMRPEYISRFNERKYCLSEKKGKI